MKQFCPVHRKTYNILDTGQPTFSTMQNIDLYILWCIFTDITNYPKTNIMRKLNLLLTVVILLSVIACNPKVNIEKEKVNVKKVVDQFTQIWETMDLDLFFKIIAQDTDMVNFGTDAAERWVGFENLKEAVSQQIAVFDEGTVDIRDQVIKLSDTGVTAWFSEITDWNLVVQGEEAVMKDCRITGILEKRDDNWVIVQFHTSLPVIGQAVEY